MDKPILYILCGLPYSGKTTLAKSLIRKLGCAYVSIDVIRDQLGFSWEENHKVTADNWRQIFKASYQDMRNKLGRGQSVVFDSTNHDFDSREKLRTYAAGVGADAKVIFIDVPVNVIWKRWEENQNLKTRSHIAKELVEWTIDHFEKPENSEQVIRYEFPEDGEAWVLKNFANNSSWINSKAEIKVSPVQGKGLFARELIKGGEEVVRWGGEYTDRVGAEVARNTGKLVMQWDDNLFSIEDRGDDDAYFINHSCEPNLWMKDAYTLIARRDINPGEELTADYALWEADENYVSRWECKCGSSRCRHKITGKDWRRPELQKHYKDHFSPLINKRMQRKEM
ncbi:MAG TPA: AAA family ATPase [Patescibacteria group bacterium]